MTDQLTERFEAHRQHLQSVALRILGSAAEADDAVQETWLRLSRSETSDIGNLRGWLTTVVARVCLDVLRSRASRREDVGVADDPGPPDASEPNAELELADSMGLALLVVLDLLSPAERVAFVLHDVFDLPFEEIAPIVGRSPAAARQLASRARRRVRGGSTLSEPDFERQRQVVEAFLTASRNGDFEALLAVLDPEVVLRADAAAVEAAAANAGRGAPPLAARVQGARAVAGVFKGTARGAQIALVGGAVGATWAPGGTPRAAFAFTLENGRVRSIEVVMDPRRIRELQVTVLASAP